MQTQGTITVELPEEEKEQLMTIILAGLGDEE